MGSEGNWDQIKIFTNGGHAFDGPRGLQANYRSGFDQLKAGLILLNLQSASLEQQELDLQSEPAANEQLIHTLEKLNDHYGRGTILLASAGLHWKKRTWSMRQDLLTPQYTTRWGDVPVAKA